MLKDRGNIKWTAMMLPEHVELLRQFARDYEKVPQPELDEQQLEEYERIIGEAMKLNQVLKIEYWKDGFIQSVEGTIHHVDIQTKKVRVLMKEDERIYIPIDSLTSLSHG